MSFDASVLIGPVSLGALFALVLIFFAGLSVALVYHWRVYGMNAALVKLAPSVYFAVGGGLIATAIVAYVELL